MLRSTSWCAIALLAYISPVFGQSSDPSFPQRSLLLDHAIDLENRQLWQEAADTYQRALRFYPQDVELERRWRSAEQLHSLNRRYHDSSFQHELLPLSDTESLTLYREVLSKIQTHYVTDIEMRELVAAGYRTLAQSLRRPIFLGVNFPTTSKEMIQQLDDRLTLAAGRLGNIQDTLQATAEMRNVARLCRVHGCRYSAAPIMEFITGACEFLDPYTAHLSPHRLSELYGMIDGNFVGLGVEVRGQSGGLHVVEVLPGSPAEAAGMVDGELIIGVDGEMLAGLTPEDAANRLQGEDGSMVELTVRNNSQIRTVAIRRRQVIVNSIRDARMLPGTGGVGYLRIESFQKNTPTELSQTLDALERQGLTGLVVDLRGNPGGLLDVSLDAANEFVDEGILVSTKGRAWGQNWSHHAHPAHVRPYSLVVLVDAESASASEIFASAIQDHERGTVIGTKTFGKGSVQSIFPLTTARTGLRLTTAHFFSPKGNRLQGKGVEPDVLVRRGQGEFGEEQVLSRRPSPEEDPQLRAAVERLSPTFVTRSDDRRS